MSRNGSHLESAMAFSPRQIGVACRGVVVLGEAPETGRLYAASFGASRPPPGRGPGWNLRSAGFPASLLSEHEFPVLSRVRDNRVALGEIPLEQAGRERVLEASLDHAPQRPRTELRIEALARQRLR